MGDELHSERVGDGLSEGSGDADGSDGGQDQQGPRQQGPPKVKVTLSQQQAGLLLMLLDRVPLEGVDTKLRAAEAQSALQRGLQAAEI